jgi:hypothetical protein
MEGMRWEHEKYHENGFQWVGPGFVQNEACFKKKRESGLVGKRTHLWVFLSRVCM